MSAKPVVPPPSAESQLTFLSKLQRLFAEGDFTSTYKHALLISLADIAVETGADDGRDLILSTRQIGERFIQLYWRQSMPYGSDRPGSSPGVLVQNIGIQAAVLTVIADFRSQFSSLTLMQARKHPAYTYMLTRVTQTVSAQPLKFLQNYGGATDPFLYERIGRGMVRLKPGVAYCLRRFHPLVQQLSRSHWVEHIKENRRNHIILGDASDLSEFLFSASRQSLALVGQGLRRLEGDRCFFCGNRMMTHDVDHFIPFGLYPRDLVENFVLAHPSCNRSKSDTLAGHPHLERWLGRLAMRGDDLLEVGERAGVLAGASTIHRVAAWGYTAAKTSGGHAWMSPTTYEAVDERYTQLLM
jgi:5-methylcytosine-specific restriction endonuclease McrA